MEKEAKNPGSDTDWQAIDIFVFSNGQQYSPPRKYHLMAEDVNLWKSTLSFLAKTQYGPFHSTVDLYTTEGKKICDPLELSNGGSYVAVPPPDSFIEAGYDKYLIKASRSWEKRKSKRIDNSIEGTGVGLNCECESTPWPAPGSSPEPPRATWQSGQPAENLKIVPDMNNNENNLECGNIQPVEEKVLLKSRVSSLANQDVSTIIKPQLLSPAQGRTVSLSSAKQTDRKRTSIQSPLVVRKITPSLLPTPNLKTSFSKRKESMKSAVTISKPEERKRSSYMPSNLSANTPSKLPQRLSKSIRPTPKSRESSLRSEAILPKVQEAIGEFKTSSSIKVTNTKNDEMLTTTNIDLENVIEDNELIQASDLYQNPRTEIPSIFVDPNQLSLPSPDMRQSFSKDIPSISVNAELTQSVLYEPVRQPGVTTVVENTSSISEAVVHLTDSEVKVTVSDSSSNIKTIEPCINIDHNLKRNDACENISIQKLQVNQYSDRTITQNAEDNINLINGEPKINIPLLHDSIQIQNSSQRKFSIKVESIDSQTKPNCNTEKLDEGFQNKIVITTCKSSETIKVYNSSPSKSSTTTNRTKDNQCILHNIEETRDLPLTAVDKTLSDQYKATLKKGDVVNLKLNIEIENNTGSLSVQKPNFNSHSVAIMQRDKGSQSNIDDRIVTQNKSLLSLITEEFKSHHTGNNNHVIILQFKTCKYCNDHNAVNSDHEANKNFVILLPIEQLVDEMKERCQCNKIQSQSQIPSIVNPVKPTHSFTSLQNISNSMEPTTNSTAQNICAKDKSLENIVLVSRKKSVAINEESTPCAPSKTSQNIDVKTQLITVSVESMTMVHSIVMENNSTQTEWCDVLLEARLLDDGHYTFRLPPIDLLKYHNLT